jgi:hypothetical protein
MIAFSWQLVVALVAVLIVVFSVSFFARNRRRSGLDQAQFLARWKEVQALYAEKNTWPLAIINADKLVDDALKKSKYKGKTMGERLVSAQHDLSSNDGIWFGHKLRNKLVHEEFTIKSKAEVKEALLGFLQALKDLGALKK